MTRCVYAGPHQPRTLDGRHRTGCGVAIQGPLQPDQTRPACPGCQPCTDRHCQLCGVAHVEQTTCPRCVGQVRSTLSDVVTSTMLLPSQATYGGADGRLEAARRIPGGEAQVLNGPGSLGVAQQWDHEYGRDEGHHSDELPSDPMPTLLLLATWEDDWRTVRDQPTGLNATLGRAFAYLAEHLSWAAQHHPAFPDFAADLRRQDAQLDLIRNDSDTGDRAGVACFDCGGELERRLTDRGLDDVWTCHRCHRRYSDPEYHLAIRARIEDERRTDEDAARSA